MSSRPELPVTVASVAAMLVGVLVLLAPARPWAGELTGLAQLSYGRPIGSNQAQSLQQLYALGFSHQMYEPLRYNFELSLNDVWGGVGPHAQVVSPRLGVDLRVNKFTAVGYYDGTLRTREPGGPWIDDVNQRLTLQLTGAPATWFSVGFSGAHNTYRTSAATADTTDDGATASLTLQGKGLLLSQTNSVQTSRDEILQFSRRQYTTGANLSYAKTLGRLSVSARYGLEYGHAEEETTSLTDVVAPREISPAAGLYAYDDMPLDSTGMGGNDRLVDGDITASVGIALGPDGTSFHNIGVDLGRVLAPPLHPDEFDELRIFVRDAAGRPVPSGEQVTWTVYTSLDGLLWQSVASTATFDTSASLYVVRFTPGDARFLKAVSLGTNLFAAYVTEIELFLHERVRPSEVQARNFLTNSGLVTLGVKPLERLGVSYTGRVNTFRTDDTQFSAHTLDWGHSIGAQAGPFGTATIDTSYGYSGSEANGSPRRTQAVLARLNWKPRREINTGVQTKMSLDTVAADWSRTIGAGVLAHLEPYPTLRLTTTLELNQQRQNVVPEPFYYVAAAGTFTARVTPALGVQGGSSLQWSVQGVQPAPGASAITQVFLYQRYFVDVGYTVSSQLNVGGRVGYTVAKKSGTVVAARASWTPLPGGAISFSSGLSHDLDIVSGRAITSAHVASSWAMNSHTSLTFSYTDSRLSRDETDGSEITTRARQIFMTLGVTL